jgi:hypothetical protein
MSFDNLNIVKTNKELDDALIGKTTKKGCIIQVDWVQGTALNCNGNYHETITKPIAGYIKYLNKKYLPEGTTQSYEFTKRKGYTKEFSVSVEVKASVGANIMGCDTSLEITTGFSYTNTINSEIEEKWTTTVTGGKDYWTYQSVILYVSRIENNYDTKSYLNAQGIDFKEKGNYLYYPTSVYKNSPQVLDVDIDPIDYEKLKTYLFNKGVEKWNNTKIKSGILIPNNINIRADNSQYLSRWGENGLKFGKSTPDKFCTFYVINLEKNKIAMRADNNLWLTRWGEHGIECHKKNIDEYCKFQVLSYYDNILVLKADNGQILTRWSDGIEAHKDNIDGYCKFQINKI